MSNEDFDRLARWARNRFGDRDEEFRAIEAISSLCEDDPDLLLTHSWPEILAMVNSSVDYSGGTYFRISHV